MAQNHVPLHGSERTLPPGARLVGPADPVERIEISVYLRPSAPMSLAAAIAQQPLHRGPLLTREEYAARYAAKPSELAKIKTFARDHGLSVVETNPIRRVVVLAGTVAAMSRAFGVELQRYEFGGRTFRGRAGPVHVPSDLAPLIEGVFGLDDRPQARPFVRIDKLGTAAALKNSYTPPQVASLYNFPTAGNGAGQTIALFEFGGGYRDDDLRAYFTQLGIPLPNVVSVSVDGARNAPTGNPRSDDGEVALDIEIAGAVAPGANIVVYFAPFSDRGWVDVVTTAVLDTVHRPSVISISWGQSESSWTLQAMRVIDQAFQTAAAFGVTVCCASGDDGARDRVNDGRAHVDFPASSPFVLSCGGTRLESSGGKVTSETVWNDDPDATGGGVSDVFDLPTWQAGAGVPPSINPGGRIGRGVPDVSANADNATGYQIIVDGQFFGHVGGTSAGAPLWAGLLGLINQQLDEPVGYINPLLYQQLINEADIVTDIVSGNNIVSGSKVGYQAGPGWDACTGLGSPQGASWLDVLIY